jgi:hypothetical protein
MDRKETEKDVKESCEEIKKIADQILEGIDDLPDDVLDEYPAKLSSIIQDMANPTL